MYEPFFLETEQQLAFDSIATASATPLALRHCDHGREDIIETDVSDYVSSSVSSQYNDECILHPVVYCSMKHAPAECNYDIYHKELTAIITPLEEWRPVLKSELIDLSR